MALGLWDDRLITFFTLNPESQDVICPGGAEAERPYRHWLALGCPGLASRLRERQRAACAHARAFSGFMLIGSFGDLGGVRN